MSGGFSPLELEAEKIKAPVSCTSNIRSRGKSLSFARQGNGGRGYTAYDLRGNGFGSGWEYRETWLRTRICKRVVMIMYAGGSFSDLSRVEWRTTTEADAENKIRERRQSLLNSGSIRSRLEVHCEMAQVQGNSQS